MLDDMTLIESKKLVPEDLKTTVRIPSSSLFPPIVARMQLSTLSLLSTRPPFLFVLTWL